MVDNSDTQLTDENKKELDMIFRMILEVNDSINRCGIQDIEGLKKLYERNMDFKVLCIRIKKGLKT